MTGRSHALPAPLADLVGVVAGIVSIDSAADNGDVALHTMRKLHRLGATWELLVDPATFCFLIGALPFLALTSRGVSVNSLVPPAPSPAESAKDGKPPARGPAALKSPNAALVPSHDSGQSRSAFFATSAGALTLAILAWMPLRAGLMMALIVHRALRVDFDSPLILMDQFRNLWLMLALLSVPVALAWRFGIPPIARAVQPSQTRMPRGSIRWQTLAAAGAAMAGVFVLVFAIAWDPPGIPQRGRILVDEFHSKWEPTQRPYDTLWYGNESGYNYACIYDYLNHYFNMGRITAPIDAKTLDECDVLISKVPTERYSPEEVNIIEKFVRRGGGVLLVGEHTDVFGTGVSLNDIASRFGFAFRYDVILDTDTSFKQVLQMPLVPHPILQRFPEFEFAVSCSIDPGASSGQAVILSRSLRGLGPDYHASNFYPQVDDSAEERYGAFVQCWTTRAGSGRVAAWTDSTDWSNFCAFEPGKAQMMLGLVAWLNQRDTFAKGLIPVLWVIGLGLVIVSIILLLMGMKPDTGVALLGDQPSPHTNGAWIIVLSAALLGWAIACPAVRAAHRAGSAERAPHTPYHLVVMDRTVCKTPVSNGGFIEGKPDGFGIFERWILRLGYFTQRYAGADAFKGDTLVFTYPSLDVPPEFREKLVAYVKQGGKVLVIDSPENKDSTANSLLYPFNVRVNHQTNEAGDLSAKSDWPTAHVAAACEIEEGIPLITLNGKTVAARVRLGSGSVTVIGFGSRFGDANMGVTGDTIPDDDLTKTYGLEYALMRWIVEGTEPSPTTMPATAPARPTGP